ncbi:hypothetical protein H696_04160 [Fonticula alba]|uniref:GMP synthase (glutamine-hydrolyzing) n=1 Tax=Fonticula alba TaxID=691883 RepID=A0A058Z648_FONAL|nr:hypothetical protein H696_04160 [Fonticula alba]KCV69750.1 hypothetical protein H696_04160 [Fonticula alba]|eukprot:XP_009496315.1 hypothetical protein H696_04160 [Fonticula alba]
MPQESSAAPCQPLPSVGGLAVVDLGTGVGSDALPPVMRFVRSVRNAGLYAGLWRRSASTGILEADIFDQADPRVQGLLDIRPAGVIIYGGPGTETLSTLAADLPCITGLGLPVMLLGTGACQLAGQLEEALAGRAAAPCKPEALARGLDLVGNLRQAAGLPAGWQPVGSQSHVALSSRAAVLACAELPPMDALWPVAALDGPWTVPEPDVADRSAPRPYGFDVDNFAGLFDRESASRAEVLAINFGELLCGLDRRAADAWTPGRFFDLMSASIAGAIHPEKHVIGAVSGGVDSSVAAALVARSLGSRFHAILVDHGCLRQNEVAEASCLLKSVLGDAELRVVDASDTFLSALDNVIAPEKKRMIIGHTFIDTFEQQSKLIPEAAYLLQGTLYTDVIESAPSASSVSAAAPLPPGQATTETEQPAEQEYDSAASSSDEEEGLSAGGAPSVKSHHNVGGLPERLALQLLEPLRLLFKHEVRGLGALCLGLPAASVWRRPFPGPGLAIRVVNAPLTRRRLARLRRADAILQAALADPRRPASLRRQIGQAFAVLLPSVRAVGVTMARGGAASDHHQSRRRRYAGVVVLRAVSTGDYIDAVSVDLPHDLVDEVSRRILAEVPGVGRVVVDVSPKPPATIEWE